MRLTLLAKRKRGGGRQWCGTRSLLKFIQIVSPPPPVFFTSAAPSLSLSLPFIITARFKRVATRKTRGRHFCVTPAGSFARRRPSHGRARRLYRPHCDHSRNSTKIQFPFATNARPTQERTIRMLATVAGGPGDYRTPECERAVHCARRHRQGGRESGQIPATFSRV